MPQLQYRGLQQTPRTHLPCSSFGISNGNGYRKCSQHKCSKVKVSCMISTNHVKGRKDSHLFRSHVDCSRFGFTVPSHLRLGLLNFMAPLDTSVYGPLISGFRSFNNCGSFARRFSSKDARVTNIRENTGVTGKKGGGNTFQTFSQHRKRANALAAHSRKTTANSNISASKDIDTVTSTELLVGDGKGDVELSSKVSTSRVNNDNQNSEIDRQRKQQSRSKKNKARKSAANASDEAVVAKGPKAKSSGVSKKSQNSTQALEVSN